MSFEVKPGYTMGDMIPLVQKLRDPETGCPWDAEQNHQTIRNDLLEEAYERGWLTDAHIEKIYDEHQERIALWTDERQEVFKKEFEKLEERLQGK